MNDTPERPGLSADDARRALDEFGPNEIPRLPPPPWWHAVLRQFASPLIFILALAAVAAAILGEVIDAGVIGAVIVLNAVLGFVQEWRAERALAALTKMLDPLATVRRDSRELRIPAREIVPGDMLLLSAGDRVAADGAFVVSRNAECDESILTGESIPVSKRTGDTVSAGTSIVAGTAEVQVTATGARTAFAEIARLTGGIDRRPTQLQLALGRLARWLGIMAILVAFCVALLGLAAGQDLLDMVLTAISLAVAIVPEGLPAVVTITLALGASAMVRRQALVRRMQAVETLGAASVICTDKTGTLTENRMFATQLWTGGRSYDVSRKGIEAQEDALPASLAARLSDVAGLCSHASQAIHDDGRTERVGSPTELALLELCEHLGHPASAQVLDEIAFSSDRKRMAMLVQRGTTSRLLVKGAPEVILARSSHVEMPDGAREIDAACRAELEETFTKMAERGLRVLALADRFAQPGDLEESGLSLLGFVGLMDPPRGEVAGAIERAHGAGIRVIMITGDSPVTARAIASSLDIPADRVLTGSDLADLEEGQLRELLAGNVLFARTRPADKLRIVRALQARGAVVAMTGDGVNDAPALKRADIGVAMGQRGTDVAQEAAELILLDDNFVTIVNAIDEGRRQFMNIKKFVRYLLSSNAGEVIALVINLIIGGPLIFLATQILWMNLVTDGVTAVALGLEKGEPDQMRRPPRTPGEPILGRAGFATILAFGTYTGAASLFLFYTYLPEDPALANTLAFTAMVVFEKMSVFAFRSFSTPVTRIGWASNRVLLIALTATLGLQVLAVYLPVLQVLLHTVPLGLEHWLWIGALSIPLIAVPEVLKFSGLLSKAQSGRHRTQPDAGIHGA